MCLQAASDISGSARSNEPFFTIERETKPSQPTSPGPRSTIQFPVQFEELGGGGLSLVSTFEPQLPQSGDPAVLPPTHPLLPTPDVGAWSPAFSAPPTSEPATNEAGIEKAKEQKVPEAEWRVSVELRLKCRKQFMDLHPIHGRLQGDQARSFFIQSRLPNSDLSAIWRLADVDRDNALSEEEFCVAMKLVLLRRKGYSLPTTVPLSLKDSATSEPRRKLGSLQASHTVGELPFPNLSQPGGLLVEVAESELHDSSLTSTAVERGEPAVATIISLNDDNEGPTSDKDTSTPSVRRALSLKQFSPPPVETDRGHTSPPASPFSPPASTETAPIIFFQNPSPKHPHLSKAAAAVSKSGYHKLSGAGEDEEGEESKELKQPMISRERGHGRSTSLDLNKMIPGSSVLSDMPAAEPPRPPPKPVAEDSDLPPQTRGRSASTGSISSTGPSLPPPSIDSSTNALLLPGTARPPPPAHKVPLLPPVPKPRRPPPPKREAKEPPPDESLSLLRDKSELQTTIRSLKDTNATLQALNRELEEKLFRLMEDRVQLAREVELARQMQTSS
ncbi:Intersectin-1 [Geodia barretti]|uniref:Intersectin-1 n=1 Tax=Geodia barretti TaxID=519541 RepID=A0AA35RH51_GEOBA|nr:Intersectin-1 [Geodia barretti]